VDTGSADDIRKYATELVALTPEVILGSGRFGRRAVATGDRTVPVVFMQTPDPVATGFVASVARSGGNATGFTQIEYGDQRKMVGAAQRDRAARYANGGPSRSRQTRSDYASFRKSIRGAIAQERIPI
jgi:hypothetical protein